MDEQLRYTVKKERRPSAMTQINDSQNVADELDDAAWEKALSDPSSQQVLKRIVASSMKGPFSVDSTTSVTKEVADTNSKDDDELR